MSLDYADVRRLSREIGDALWARLERGELPKIGIDEIRDAIRSYAPGGLNLEHPDGAKHLERLTTEHIVRKC